MIFVAGDAAPVAWAEAPEGSDTRARVELAVGAMYAEHDASAVYGEIRKDVWLGARWVVTPKFAAGLYHDGSGLDLGNDVEFREGVVLSWVGRRLRLGTGFYHASNGGLGEHNPGTEVLEVVFGLPIGTTPN